MKSLECVLRASRRKSTRRRGQRRDAPLIKPYQQDKWVIQYLLPRDHSLFFSQFRQNPLYVVFYLGKICYLIRGINEHYVHSQRVDDSLIEPIRLPYATFQQITVHRPLEMALRHAHQYPILPVARIRRIAILQTRHTPPMSFLHNGGYGGLSANPFVFRKSMSRVCRHYLLSSKNSSSAFATDGA